MTDEMKPKRVGKPRPARLLGDEVLVEVRGLMRARGIRQRDLADAINVSTRTIRRVLSGERDVCLDDLGTICDILGVDLVDVINTADERLPEQARRFGPRRRYRQSRS